MAGTSLLTRMKSPVPMPERTRPREDVVGRAFDVAVGVADRELDASMRSGERGHDVGVLVCDWWETLDCTLNDTLAEFSEEVALG